MPPTNDKVDQSGADERLRIAQALMALYDSKKEAHGVHGQIIGMEPYVIKATGNSLCVLLDAANMLANFRPTQTSDDQALQAQTAQAVDNDALRKIVESPQTLPTSEAIALGGLVHSEGVQAKALTELLGEAESVLVGLDFAYGMHGRSADKVLIDLIRDLAAWAAKPSAPADVAAVRDAALEEAAILVETTRETTTVVGGGETQRHLTARKLPDHDLTGRTWAIAIRALKSAAPTNAK